MSSFGARIRLSDCPRVRTNRVWMSRRPELVAAPEVRDVQAQSARH